MTLTIGEIKTTFDSGYFLTDSDPRYGGKENQPPDLPSIQDGRCIQLGFPIGNLAAENAQPATLVIPQLELSQPEVIPRKRSTQPTSNCRRRASRWNSTFSSAAAVEAAADRTSLKSRPV
jgi:hypothetical protein